MTATLTKTRTVLAAVSLGLCCLLAACAPSGAGQGTSAEGSASSDAGTGSEAPVVAVDWSPESDCVTCHENEGASLSDTACELSAHPDLRCVDCHADEASLSQAHEGATADGKKPTKLKATEVDQAACLECHYGSVEALAEATAGTVTVVDSQGTEANPHEVLLQEQHAEIACADCHNMHSDKDVTEVAHNECLSCHHTDVFQCYTCHE